MSTPSTADGDDKVEAGGDKLQAQSEQRLADMAANADLKGDAHQDADRAEKKINAASS